MTKGKWCLISALLLLSAILIQLFKSIHYFDKDLIDGLSGAFLGVGLAILFYTLFSKKKK
jgi:glycopeptide antibiotics resistance protein